MFLGEVSLEIFIRGTQSLYDQPKNSPSLHSIPTDNDNDNVYLLPSTEQPTIVLLAMGPIHQDKARSTTINTHRVHLCITICSNPALVEKPFKGDDVINISTDNLRHSLKIDSLAHTKPDQALVEVARSTTYAKIVTAYNYSPVANRKLAEVDTVSKTVVIPGLPVCPLDLGLPDDQPTESFSDGDMDSIKDLLCRRALMALQKQKEGYAERQKRGKRELYQKHVEGKRRKKKSKTSASLEAFAFASSSGAISATIAEITTRTSTLVDFVSKESGLDLLMEMEGAYLEGQGTFALGMEGDSVA